MVVATEQLALMLRAGRAPVGFRGPRVGGDYVERHPLNSIDVPARAGRLQPALGCRGALLRGELPAHAPHLEICARRESIADASRRVRSRGKRAAEVRPALCLTLLSSARLTVMSQAPQADAPITVWVKRMDIAGAQYVAVKGVDLQQTVSKFKARWLWVGTNGVGRCNGEGSAQLQRRWQRGDPRR